MIKNIIIVIETIIIVALVVLCINFYNRMPGEVIENQENENDVEDFLEQTNLENTVPFKEGTYVNSDDPELHLLTFENGMATSETYAKQVGTYRVTGNKLFVYYTESYDPDGNPMEVEMAEELYRIEGDRLVQEQPYQMVYKLQ